MINAKVVGNLLANAEAKEITVKSTGEIKRVIAIRVMSNQYKYEIDPNTGEKKKVVDPNKSFVVYGILATDPESAYGKIHLEQLKKGMRVVLDGYGLTPFNQIDQESKQIKTSFNLNVESVSIGLSDRIRVDYLHKSSPVVAEDGADMSVSAVSDANSTVDGSFLEQVEDGLPEGFSQLAV
jgi:hypothetical protein